MPHLDDAKRQQFLMLVRIGCSRRAACLYVGCDPGTIRYQAAQNPEFAEQLNEAEMRREVAHLQNINAAGKKNWRASAWLLERQNPADFAPPEQLAIAREQTAALIGQFAAIVANEIRDPATLGRIEQRLARLLDPTSQGAIEQPRLGPVPTANFPAPEENVAEISSKTPGHSTRKK